MWNYTALAESADGIQWNKPNLGIVDFQGNKQNNLIWPVAGQPGSDIFPFKDANPQASPEERYKALANVGEHQLVALVSRMASVGACFRKSLCWPIFRETR